MCEREFVQFRQCMLEAVRSRFWKSYAGDNAKTDERVLAVVQMKKARSA